MKAPYVRDEITEKLTEETSGKEWDIPRYWVITEWVDGLPVRLHYDPSFGVSLLLLAPGGGEFVEAIMGEMDVARFSTLFGHREADLCGVIYGAGISSTAYGTEGKLRLHDLFIDGELQTDSRLEAATTELGLYTVPELGVVASLEEARNWAKQGVASAVAQEDGGVFSMAAGIVGRTDPPLLTREGERLQFKMRMRDF